MSPKISFDLWTSQLRMDCEQKGKALEFRALGDFVRKLLWEDGVDPTVKAIISTQPQHQEQTEIEQQKTPVTLQR